MHNVEQTALQEVLGPTQIKYIPQHIKNAEQLAMARFSDIPVKQSWRYITAARRALGKKYVSKIFLDPKTLTIKACLRLNADTELIRHIIVPFIPHLYNHEKLVCLGKEGETTVVFKLVDPEERLLKEFQEPTEIPVNPEVETQPSHVELPRVSKGLFDEILGHDDLKTVIVNALNSPRSVNILLVGPPASAKSLFLEAISRCPGAVYTFGESTSKAGLAQLLIDKKPRILIIDEFHNMAREDMAFLLGLADGKVVRTKADQTANLQLDTKVFAAANRLKNIPEEVLSRFLKFELPHYTPKQFRQVVIHVLRIEGVETQLAEYIADRMIEAKVMDPRQAKYLSRIAKTPSMVDLIISRLKHPD